MDNSNKKNPSVPELDPDTASSLLTNVFAECDVAPNAIPLETLESWGNYKKTEFRAGRIISYIILVLLVLMPLAFFKPTVIAQRTNVESAQNAVYKIQIKTLLPVEAVSATLNDVPVTLDKVDSKHYQVSLKQNGRLNITAVSLNGQRSVKAYDVTHLDMEKPFLVKSYTEGGKVYITVRDTYSGIDYDKVIGRDSAQNEIPPLSIDEDNDTIVYEVPAQSLTIDVPDMSGNILQILLSPA